VVRRARRLWNVFGGMEGRVKRRVGVWSGGVLVMVRWARREGRLRCRRDLRGWLIWGEGWSGLLSLRLRRIGQRNPGLDDRPAGPSEVCPDFVVLYLLACYFPSVP
jgi:hypothetical protein